MSSRHLFPPPCDWPGGDSGAGFKTMRSKSPEILRSTTDSIMLALPTSSRMLRHPQASWLLFQAASSDASMMASRTQPWHLRVSVAVTALNSLAIIFLYVCALASGSLLTEVPKTWCHVRAAAKNRKAADLISEKWQHGCRISGLSSRQRAAMSM